MFDFIPDVERLTQIFSQAIAPTFFLGAVAAQKTTAASAFTRKNPTHSFAHKVSRLQPRSYLVDERRVAR